MNALGKIILVAVVGLTLAGCTPPQPMMFGVPQTQWNTLTQQQKQQVIQGYNQRQRINAQNAPINNAISDASSIIRNNNYYKNNPGFAPMPPMPSMPNM
jgi:hypothetical protein